MKAAVVFESRTGNTMEAAQWVGGALEAAGVDATVMSVRDMSLDVLAAADIVFVGTWTDGIFVVGQRPGGARQLRQLPMLWDKPVAAFCTYALNPGRTADKLGRLLERKGGVLFGTAAFKAKELPDGVAAFVDDVLGSLVAAAA